VKIIQLLAAIDGESPGTIGSQIYGLGDDGAVYELVSPSKTLTHRNQHAVAVRYFDGETGGWRLVVQSHERTETIPNPDRPLLK
jgi:hypothetical protein